MLSSNVRTTLTLGLLSAVAIACSQPSPPAAPRASGSTSKSKASAPASETAAFGLPVAVPKLRFMPDVDGSRGLVMRTDEGELSLVGRIRLSTTAAGITARADELLPQGRIVAQRVPSRLGGGFIFLAVTGRGTELWRSTSWLGKLEPFASFGTAHNDRPLTMGFDRIYLRLSSNELVALDPKTGGVMPYGPLPVAPAYGEMLFLDGWRAVVDTDIGGTLATFDAGATWRRLAVAGRVRGVVPSASDPDDGGEAIVQVDGGGYRLNADGHLSFSASAGVPTPFATPPTDPEADKKAGAKSPGPLGKKPLRVALERGFPDSASSAIVAHEGALARVSLDTGAVTAVTEHAYADEHAECSGVALGTKGARPEDSIGFVCGSPLGDTVIYAFERPLKLREVMRFDGPRVVTESGQGALVVRGPCPGGADSSEARPFCVRFADGATREVRIRGEVGAERVVALEDGRVVIIVPPRVGTQGQISILEGKSSKHVVLKMPEGGAPREIETGMWLEGFHQAAKDEVAGWVEAGGPTFGVRIKLDGTVTIGDVIDEPGGVVVGGRFGLALGDHGHLRETVDTGITWREIELPRVDDAANLERSRRCGAVGCVLPSWLKIGWGESAHEDDLREAVAPPGVKSSSIKLSAGPVSLTCRTGRSEPKAKGSGKKNQGVPLGGWLGLDNVEAPAMQTGEVGVDNGAPFDAVPMRAYVWGKKESDWSRTGRFLVRFSNKLSLDEVRSSAVTTSPWANEAAASEAFGLGTYGYNAVTWSAQRDHDAALVSACRGRVCNLFSVEPEQPVLTLRTNESGGLSKPFQGSAAKVGQVWFYLGDSGMPETVTLYRADLGHVRQVAAFRRLMSPRFSSAAMPKLVRRAKSDGLGLTFVLREGPTDKRGARYVLPIDPDSGVLGDPVRLGRPDLADMAVTAGCGDRDGWVMELPLEPAPEGTLDGGHATFDTVELRLRMEEGSACIDAGAASVSGGLSAGDKKGKGEGKTKPVGSAFSLMASDRASLGRRELVCETKPRNPLSIP
ncbi:MAG: hypothetical protein HOW73_45005 [Polyangiaceae bacterium]|nr:hypothetical protein [Polyangiaceae bacterium]